MSGACLAGVTPRMMSAGGRLLPQCAATRRGVRCIRNVAHRGRHNPGIDGLHDWNDVETDAMGELLREFVGSLSTGEASAAAAALTLVLSEPALAHPLRRALLRRQGFPLLKRPT